MRVIKKPGSKQFSSTAGASAAKPVVSVDEKRGAVNENWKCMSFC